MKKEWIAAVTSLTAAGCAVVYAGVQRSVRRTLAEQKAQADRQIAALNVTVKSLHSRVNDLNRLVAERSEELPIEGQAENACGETPEALTPEMLAVITAATTTYVGRAARIRSAKLVPTPDGANPWTQQGRAIVHTRSVRPRD